MDIIYRQDGRYICARNFPEEDLDKVELILCCYNTGLRYPINLPFGSRVTVSAHFYLDYFALSIDGVGIYTKGYYRNLKGELRINLFQLEDLAEYFNLIAEHGCDYVLNSYQQSLREEYSRNLDVIREIRDEIHLIASQKEFASIKSREEVLNHFKDILYVNRVVSDQLREIAEARLRRFS